MPNKLKLAHIIMILMVILIISNVIKFYPITMYSSMPSQFGGGSEYFGNYIKDNGHTLEKGEITTYGVYSNMIYGQANNPAFAIFVTIIEMLIGNLSPILLDIIRYSMFAFIFLVVILLFAKKDENGSPNIILFGLIACFALLGVPYLVTYMGANAAIGWILITLSLYLYTRKADIRMRFLFCLLPCVLPLLYFTPSMLYLLLLFTLMCYTLVAKKERRNWNFVIFSFIFYSSIWVLETSQIGSGRLAGVINLFSTIYNVYNNQIRILIFLSIFIIVLAIYVWFNRYNYNNTHINRFNILISSWRNFIRNHRVLLIGFILVLLSFVATRYIDSLRGFIFFNSAGIGNAEIVKHLLNTSGENKLRLAVNATFVAVPVFYFIIYGHRKVISRNKPVLWTLIASLIPLSLLLYIWLGLLGVARLSEWGGLVSIIVFSAMINTVDNISKKFLSFIVIIALISSVNAYINDENTPTLHLTTGEEYGSKWILLQIDKDRFVFTDFRLAGSLVGNGHLKVTGANEVDLGLVTGANEVDWGLSSFIKSLNTIYYGNDSKAASDLLNRIYLMNNQHIEYLFFSKQMEKSIPGIKGYDYGNKPAPIGFAKKFDDKYINARIYDNGITYVYQI